jgi:hypothetical protein
VVDKFHSDNNMTDGIFQTNPIPQPTQAQMAADELLRNVRSEIDRRAGQHIDGWRAFWEHPAASPQDIADAMNGDAVRWLALARLNLQHIAGYAQLIGKSLDEFVPTKYQSSPKTVTSLTNGYIQIGE